MPESAQFEDFVDLVSGSFETPETDDAPEADQEPEFSDMVQESTSEHTAHGDFTVTVNKSGNAVESLDVECGCGKKIRILLDYEG